VKKTGIELPAESAGLVNPPEKWSGLSLASIAIGYEISVTTLQMASAFASIANDGVRVSPHIVKEIRSGDEIVYKPEVNEFRVLSAETARKLRRMLEYAVLEGTGKRALIKGYTTGGKTGTAWKYDERLKKYNQAKYVSSFIGFAPVENPSVVIAVVIDEPKVAERNGGDVAIFVIFRTTVFIECNLISPVRFTACEQGIISRFLTFIFFVPAFLKFRFFFEISIGFFNDLKIFGRNFPKT